MKPLSFFLSNIGNTIFRDDDGCSCLTCKRVVEHGIKVRDKQHAYYLYDLQNDYHAEGIELNYRTK